MIITIKKKSWLVLEFWTSFTGHKRSFYFVKQKRGQRGLRFRGIKRLIRYGLRLTANARVGRYCIIIIIIISHGNPSNLKNDFRISYNTYSIAQWRISISLNVIIFANMYQHLFICLFHELKNKKCFEYVLGFKIIVHGQCTITSIKRYHSISLHINYYLKVNILWFNITYLLLLYLTFTF